MIQVIQFLHAPSDLIFFFLPEAAQNCYKQLENGNQELGGVESRECFYSPK